MIPINTRGDVAPAPLQAAGQPPGNPAPPQPAVPQMQMVDVPDDPRGAKRRREEESPESSEPSLKRARVDSSDDDSSGESFEEEERTLMYYIVRGDAKQVGELIKKSPQLLEVHLPDEDGYTPLCLAAVRGRLDIVRMLASAGCAIDAPAMNGSTPLMFAAQQGDVKMITLLCRLAAKPFLIDPSSGWDALTWAITHHRFDACKALIAEGADLCQILNIEDGKGANPIAATPLSIAITSDFVELIDWWLEENKVAADSWEPSAKTSMVNVAISTGALAVIRLLLKRGAHMYSTSMITKDETHLLGPWQIAMHFNHVHVIEYFLSEGIPITISAPTNSSLSRTWVPIQTRLTSSQFFSFFGWGVVTDMYNHLVTQVATNTRADRVTHEQLWRHPEQAIEQLARCGARTSTTLTNVAVASWCDQGLLGTMLSNENFIGLSVRAAHLLGQTISHKERFSSGQQAVEAQQTQILVEVLSDQLCSPNWPQCFSGFKLTPIGEQTMNQIAVAQGELMLKGIANLRTRFERQVASLPDICMNIYISRTNQLNDADLSKRITSEWGLYEPIARAVIRLVKVAYEKLCALTPESVTAEFAALPPAEQLRHTIVDTLEEWDKIPEIVETLLKCESSVLDFVSNLLFQQWRLFGEAFGVTKPRYSQFGPHRQEVVEVEPQMEVDEEWSTSLAPVPLTPQ